MPNKFIKYPLLVFKLSLLFFVLAMPWSRALTSIFTVLLFISAIAELLINKTHIPKNINFWILGTLFLFCLLDGLRVNSVSEWFSYFNIKLPLILFSFSVLVFQTKIDSTFLKQFSIFFCSSIAITTFVSSINYITHFDELNALVLQSKPIPIMGEIHHITFSVFCAFTVIISSYYAYLYQIKWLWIIAFINFIGLHLLAARTGLVGFYFACFVLGFMYVLNHKLNLKSLIISLSAIVLLPIIAFYSIGSFHNRIINSIEDIKVIWNQKDANYQSMGMRVIATKTAIDIVKKHPLIGVGCSNIKQAIAIQYEENNTNLFIENRILPHNQFVMEAAIHGIIGLIIILLFFIYPLFNHFSKSNPIFVALWSLVFFACMFECLFDRQHGIILVSLFWFLYNIKPNLNLT